MTAIAANQWHAILAKPAALAACEAERSQDSGRTGRVRASSAGLDCLASCDSVRNQERRVADGKASTVRDCTCVSTALHCTWLLARSLDLSQATVSNGACLLVDARLFDLLQVTFVCAAGVLDLLQVNFIRDTRIA